MDKILQPLLLCAIVYCIILMITIGFVLLQINYNSRYEELCTKSWTNSEVLFPNTYLACKIQETQFIPDWFREKSSILND